MGFLAVFAAAANAPITCIFMVVEIFGLANLFPISLACFVAYFCSGHTSIYSAQLTHWKKYTIFQLK
jgi:H+/Cl- antiporter ClcA